MRILAKLIFELFRLIFKSKRDLILENLALRQQLAVQQRSIKRPKDQKQRPYFLGLAIKILE